MTTRHLVNAAAIALTTAFLLLILVAVITGGRYSHGLGGLDVILVIPMFIAAKLGIDRPGALTIAFGSYFLLIFALMVAYISRTVLKGKPSAKLPSKSVR
jgi:hypothetical protein